MKTDKYTIEFSGWETLNTEPITLTKKEFELQLKKLNEQHEAHMNDDEGPTEKRVYTSDLEKLVHTSIFFSIGTSDIILHQYHCKPGYHFK